MGYETYFDGDLTLDKPLDHKQAAAINSCKKLDGDWSTGEDFRSIGPEGGQHYDYDTKLRHVLKHLKRWGVVAQGYIEWDGEEWDDHGVMRVLNNELSVGTMRLEYDFGNGEVMSAGAVNAARERMWEADLRRREEEAA